MKDYIGFFDLDNTILDSSSGKLFIKYSFDNGIIGLRELIFGIYIGFIHRMGLYDTEETIKKWAMKYRGTSERELIDFSNRWFQEVVVNHFREAAVREIDYHSSNGGKTVILSAATTYICNPTRDFLKMEPGAGKQGRQDGKQPGVCSAAESPSGVSSPCQMKVSPGRYP